MENKNENIVSSSQENREIAHKKAVRTYATDMAKALRDEQGSVIKIAVAEHKKRQEEMSSASLYSRKNKIFLMASITVIILAVLLIMLTFSSSNKEVIIPEDEQIYVPTLIFADAQAPLDVTDLLGKKILESAYEKFFEEEKVRPGIVLHVFPIEISPLGQQFLTTTDFFNKIESLAPSSLFRSVSPLFMVGAFTDISSIPHPFLLFKVNPFDIAFAGMLSWEKTILKDLDAFFHIEIPDENKRLYDKKFTDTIIENISVRALLDLDDNIVLLYAFIDEQFILITADPQIIGSLLERIRETAVR